MGPQAHHFPFEFTAKQRGKTDSYAREVNYTMDYVFRKNMWGNGISS